MNKKIINVLKYILFLGIGITLLWLTFRNENLYEIFLKIKHAKPGWIILSLVISFFAFLSRAIRWKMLIEPLGYKPKLTHTFYSLLTGYFANFAVPRIGEITRCASLSKAEKIPFDKLVGTVITERVFDVLMLLVAMLVAAVVEFDLIGNFLYQKLFRPVIEKISATGSTSVYIVVAVILVLLILIVFYFFKSEKFNVVSNKVRKFLSGIFDGIKSVRHLKSIGWFTFHTVFMWVLYFFCSYVCFFALDATEHLGVKEGLLVLVLGGIGMSAPVQGGIGVYHWIVSQGLMLFGIAENDGKTYATMVHTYQVFVIVALGLFSFIMLFLANKKQNMEEGVESN